MIHVVAGRACTKQWGRLDRWQGWSALVPGEAAAMRRVQAPIRGCVELSINHLGPAPTLVGGMAGEKLIADNRRARHDYELLERFEAGLVLTGTEVKSLRDGRASL